jgi:hypothetical protein
LAASTPSLHTIANPIDKNPAPPGYPAHAAWEAATRQAEIEVLSLKGLTRRRFSGVKIGASTGRAFDGVQPAEAETTWLDYRASRAPVSRHEKINSTNCWRNYRPTA